MRDGLKDFDRITIHLGRDTLIPKIESLIYLTLNRLLELNATRGLVTAETSELDVQIEELVMLLVFDKLQLSNENIDEIIHFYVDDFLKKSPDWFLKKYNEVGFKNWFHKIEAARKWSIFRDLLKKVSGLEIKKFLDKNKTYSTEVIKVRNRFAHAKATFKNNKQYLAGFGPDGVAFEFDESQCIQIRKCLIEHRNNFDELANYFRLNNEPASADQ